MLSLAAVRAARERIAGRIHTTPVMSSTRLGARAGVRLVLKCENFQKTGSFKVRGALNYVRQLGPAERERGVVTFSAGNYAQALAWAATDSGVHATVVMPAKASPQKAAASRDYGAEVVLFGANGMEALGKMREIERERGLLFSHPFDDEHVMAGQGTVGLELLEQAPDLDVVVVPVGGGGLIGGILVAIKESNPKIRVYGVEPTGAAGMRRSLDAGHALTLDAVSTVADGLAAPMAGTLTFEIVKRYVDDVVTLDDDVIVAGLRDVLTTAKLVAEPAGAAATAAVLSGVLPLRKGERVAAILSGGNVDAARLATFLG
jgi:threonine dehydratase